MKRLVTFLLLLLASPAFAVTPKTTTKKKKVVKKAPLLKKVLIRQQLPTLKKPTLRKKNLPIKAPKKLNLAAKKPLLAKKKTVKTTKITSVPLYTIDSLAQKNPPAGTALARILETQHLRVCVRSDIPPFGYFSAKGLTGFDVVLAAEIATRLSIDYKKNIYVDWMVITAGSRITSLQQKSCDMVIAAFSYTPIRAKLVGFSKIYLQTDKVLVAANKITRKTPIIARVKGTTGNIKGIKGIVRYFNNYQEIIYAMENGKVDYIITDQPIALHMIRSVTKLYKITKVLAKNAEKYAIGVNKANKYLLKAINRALLDLAQSGRLAYLHRQWL